MRARHVPALLLASACTVGCAREAADAPPAPRANVLMVVIDTLRADGLGLGGAARPTSPRLDALARESLVVERSVAQASWTKPSMASIFTSLHPGQHGTVEETTANRLAPSLTTLAECFARGGYHTGGVSENPHVSPATGFERGFETLTTLNGFRGDRAWVVHTARQWLTKHAETRADAPFFLYVHFLDPHGPYEPGPPWRERFTDGLTTDQPLVREGKVGPLSEGTELKVALTPGDVAYLRALYEAEIREADAAVESLLGELEARGWLADTVVLVTSDHGEEFLEHDALKHGYQLYEETLRVPLVLRVPGVAPRREREATAQHIDLAPTLLELVGLAVPPTFQGRSLVPLVRGEPLAAAAIVSETSWRGIDLACARLGRHKLIVDRVADRELLFDLVDDPAETRDRLADEPAVAGRLRSAIERAETPPAGVTLQGLEGHVDPAAEQALKAIGYFGK